MGEKHFFYNFYNIVISIEVAEMVLKATMDLFGQSELAEMITGPNIADLKNL